MLPVSMTNWTNNAWSTPGTISASVPLEAGAVVGTTGGEGGELGGAGGGGVVPPTVSAIASPPNVPTKPLPLKEASPTASTGSAAS